jgi:hypothetical protein
MYVALASSSLALSLPYLLYMISDPGNGDKKLYEYNKRVLGIDLVCPLLKDIKVLPKRGLRLYVFFYQSALGQVTIYSQIKISIESLILHTSNQFLG